MKQRKISTYLLISGLAYFLEMAAILALTTVSQLNSYWVIILSHGIGLLATLLFQRIFNFNNITNAPKLFSRQVLQYGVLALGNFIFLISLAKLLDGLIDIYALRTLATFCTVCWNFWIYRFIFNDSKSGKQKVRQKLAPIVIMSLIILALTTIFWSVATAILHNNNADQLVNTHLFEDIKSSIFPGTHTFLLKFPLFVLNLWLGASGVSFIVLTTIISVMTVSGLAYVLYRIEKRPIIFSLLILALASVLVYVPMQVKPGVPLPVNFAMLTTRNLEYMLYIFGLVSVFKSKSWLKSRFWLGVFALSLVAASDKLFLVLLIGAAVLGFVVALASKKTALQKQFIKLIVAALFVWIVSILVLQILTGLSLIAVNQHSSVNPYHFSFEFKAVPYAVTSVLTNFGANIVYDIGFSANFIGAITSRLANPLNFGYFINLIIFGFLTVLAGQFIWRLLRKKSTTNCQSVTALSLVLSSVVAMSAFVFTSHYYLVDARYLTIVFLALYLTGAIHLSQKKNNLPLKNAWPVVVVLIGGLILGLGKVYQDLQIAQEIDRPLRENNQLVSQALEKEGIRIIMGDYWRVVPIKGLLGEGSRAIGLDTCAKRRKVLTDGLKTDLARQDFAFLWVRGSTKTAFPSCDLAEITKLYGPPNSQVVISGSSDNPNEVLLIYRRGSSSFAEHQNGFVTIKDMPSGETQCPDGANTIVIAVAHQDDSILFMSPDLIKAIEAKQCIRTVFLTAGDAGSKEDYWLGRNRGIQTAYANLANVKNSWQKRHLVINNQISVAVANLEDNSRISLVFLNLPDGNINGNGHLSTSMQSLAQLYSGISKKLTSVDGLATYSSSGLKLTLSKLIELYGAQSVWTHSLRDITVRYPDHSDHRATGRYMKEVYDDLSLPQKPTWRTYFGYSVKARPANVWGRWRNRKTDAFFVYGDNDRATCNSQRSCRKTAYDSYIKRQYIDEDY